LKDYFGLFMRLALVLSRDWRGKRLKRLPEAARVRSL
jgi:hypothetical protein